MIAKIPAAVASLLLCAGFVCTPRTNPPPEDRLKVTDELRDACAGYLTQETDIQEGLDINEANRLAGMNKQELLDHNEQICSSHPFSYTECITCNNAIIEQIYSIE